MALKYLSEDQNAAFDAEFHSPEELKEKMALVRHHFPNGPRSILDVGGGNGRFLDYVLDEFPSSEGVLLDVSEHLLSLNHPHPRKTLVQASVDDIRQSLAGRKFDLITVNWLLHHLVGPTYGDCRRNCVAALELCRDHLNPGGVIFVAENLFEGYAGLNLPSHVIYAITSVKYPPFVARARRFFNTAGVGVCFRNERDWRSILAEAKLVPVDTLYRPWRPEPGIRGIMMSCLGLRSRGHGHFFCPV